jgi:hypothetical protein
MARASRLRLRPHRRRQRPGRIHEATHLMHLLAICFEREDASSMLVSDQNPGIHGTLQVRFRTSGYAVTARFG